MTSPVHPIGMQVRDWRQHRRATQMHLAFYAGISTRHLSFVEIGRSRPSREVLLRLADRLDVSLREQNGMLLAAGFAPAHRERSWEYPELSAIRTTIGRLLVAHEPNPALLIDRHWTCSMRPGWLHRCWPAFRPRC